MIITFLFSIKFKKSSQNKILNPYNVNHGISNIKIHLTLFPHLFIYDYDSDAITADRNT